MILPLGLGHKHIQTSYVSWLFFLSSVASYYEPSIMEGHYLRWVLSFTLILAMAPYVEMRMGTLLTLILTLFMGALGGHLLLESAPYYFSPFLAASGVTGCFYALFYSKDFKLGFWRVINWKYIAIESSFFVPFLFVLFWWVYIFSVSFNNTLLIENLFPVGSLLFGLVIGYFFKKKHPVPKGFLYEFEWENWKTVIKKNVELKKMAQVAKRILDFNPDNLKVQYDICKKIAIEFNDESWNHKKLISFFNKQLNSLLEHLMREKRMDSGLELLLSLPIKSGFQKVFTNISSQSLFHYGQAAKKKKLNILAISLYVAYVEKNPKGKKKDMALKGVDYLLEIEMDLQSHLDILQFLEAQAVHPELNTLFKQHFQFSRTALVTGIRKMIS